MTGYSAVVYSVRESTACSSFAGDPVSQFTHTFLNTRHTVRYPHAPSLVEAGPGPELLGTHPAPTHDDTPVAAGVVGSRAGGHGPPLVPAAAILEGATGLMPASPPAGVGAQGGRTVCSCVLGASPRCCHPGRGG